MAHKTPVSCPPQLQYGNEDIHDYLRCTHKFIERKCIPLHNLAREIGRLMAYEVEPVLVRNSDNLDPARLRMLANEDANFLGIKHLDHFILSDGATLVPPNCSMSPSHLRIQISQPQVVRPLFNDLYNLLNNPHRCTRMAVSSCSIFLDGRCLWELLTNRSATTYWAYSGMYRDTSLYKGTSRHVRYLEYYSAECLTEMLQAFITGITAEFPKYWEFMGSYASSIFTDRYHIPMYYACISANTNVGLPDPDGSGKAVYRDMLTISLG